MQGKAVLLLEDGTLFTGRSFGADGEVTGEVVFNTSMTGYQEILTDPSYREQIVTMTYPLIGNYGVNSEDVESSRIQVQGFIVRENSRIVSNFRAEESLSEYLRRNGIVAAEGMDTRAITRKIRLEGAMKGILSTVDFDKESLSRKLSEYPGLVGRDIVKDVAPKEPYTWKEEGIEYTKKVVAIDCGMKKNILRLLGRAGCKVEVVPPWTDKDDILRRNPDGIFISNGPGDPAPLSYVIELVRSLLGLKPIFGICLGHQILSLALGGSTFKLKFGHRGANQPVRNMLTGRVEITSQNHGFAVDTNSLKDPDILITHINLNDMTLEGIYHKKLGAFSVQYHPEASPGPHDASYLFSCFVKLMEGREPFSA